MVQADIKEGWMQAVAFPQWQGSGHHLLGFGMEHFWVQNIIPSGLTERCQAYIYSPHLQAIPKSQPHSAPFAELRALVPPPGFLPAPQHLKGYLFIQALPELEIPSFCRRAELKHHLVRSLRVG